MKCLTCKYIVPVNQEPFCQKGNAPIPAGMVNFMRRQAKAGKWCRVYPLPGGKQADEEAKEGGPND